MPDSSDKSTNTIGSILRVTDEELTDMEWVLGHRRHSHVESKRLIAKLRSAREENARLRAALRTIASAGRSPTAVLNIPEADWSFRLFGYCQRIAKEALNPKEQS